MRGNWVVPRLITSHAWHGTLLWEDDVKEKLQALQQEAMLAIGQADSESALDQVRHQYLGKKGALTLVLKTLGQLSPEERRAAGMAANEVKEAIAQAITSDIATNGALLNSSDLANRLSQPIFSSLSSLSAITRYQNKALRHYFS